MDVKVSVIIPVYGVERYVARCLHSIMSQTFQEPFECVIVDDCSPDRSMEIVEQLVANYTGSIHFNIVRHKENRGLAVARNTGLFMAKGDYILHLDSDDFIEPDALAFLYQEAINTDADIVVADYFLTYGIRNVYQRLYIPDTRERLLGNLITGVMPNTVGRANWNKLIKRDLYMDNGIRYVEGVDYNEDLLVMLPLCYHARRIVKLDRAFVHYVQTNGSSFTKRISRKNIEDKLRANERINQFLATYRLGILVDALNQKKMQDWAYALIGCRKEELRTYFFLYPELDSDFRHFANVLPLYWRGPILLARRGHLGTFCVCRTVLQWIKRLKWILG